MYSFRAKKVMMMSDPKHWDHILPFMQPGDVPHRIVLTDVDIRAMYFQFRGEGVRIVSIK